MPAQCQRWPRLPVDQLRRRFKTPLLGRLRLIYADQIQQYEQSLDRGEQAFSDLLLFARQQSNQLRQVMVQIGDSDIDMRAFRQRVGLFSLLAESGDRVLEEVRNARAINDAQPIPDYETARSIMAEALSQWAQQLADMAGQYERWSQQSDLSPQVRQFVGNAATEYVRVAQQLAEASEPLRQLPPIELATIGRQLSTGEAAVVIGPERAAVIPSQQLLPQVTRGGALTFDRRFRGEQLISSTIRSLMVPRMPMVVFVHNESNSLLRRQPDQADLLGVASLLNVSRFDVREWIVSESQRPEPDPQQRAVWIVMPPTSRSSLSIGKRERELLEAARTLIAEGEPVLLNVYPSLLPSFNQPDPWAEIAASMGVEAQTDRVVFERLDLGGESDEPVIERSQVIEDFYCNSPICRAVHGQRLVLPLPVPVRPNPDDSPGASYTTIASIDGARNRWLEREWSVDDEKLNPPKRGDRMFQPVPVVIAIDRRTTDSGSAQRMIVAGSGAWLMSYLADAAEPLGGGRMALRNPGNQELLLASVAWLAHMDELIAPSAVSQQVARLDGVTRRVWLRWFLITAVGAPVGCLVLAGIVFAVRRI